MRTAILLYKTEQLVSLDALLADAREQSDEPLIVSLDAEIDYELEKRGMMFISGRTLQNRETPDAYLRADKLTEDLFSNDTCSAFMFRGISLLEPLRFSAHIYFILLLTYIDIISRAAKELKSRNIGRLIVPCPTEVILPTSGFLAEHEAFMVVEAARLVAETNGLVFDSVQSAPKTLRAHNKLRLVLFMIQRSLFGIMLSLLNAVTSLLPRRPVRIVASDYWRNIAPVANIMPDAEIIMLDRKEAFKAGWRNIFHHRMRFVHIEDFLRKADRQIANRSSLECKKTWQDKRSDAWKGVDFMFCGVSLETLCEDIFDRLFERAVPRVAEDIAGAYSLYERFSPDVAWVRASVSTQIHFSVLSLVGTKLGVPSLEPQHGIDYSGPGSATNRHSAQYFALYGQLVCDEFKEIGFSSERLLATGSPRFDSYTKDKTKRIMHKSQKISILSNTPTTTIGWHHGTYTVEKYFKALGDSIRDIQNAHLVITSRSTHRDTFFSEARNRGLREHIHENAEAASLSSLFQRADVFVCSYSTVVYEALLYHLPVIIAAFAPVERMMADFHFGQFEKAGALRIAHTPEELVAVLAELADDPAVRARLSAAGWDFMQKNFSFDGRASERIASLIRNWKKSDGIVH